MKSKAEVMKKLDMVAKEIEDTEAQRMNAMLAPQPYDCDVESQIVKIRYEAQEWENNHRGEIHGGAVSAMFDTSMGMSVLSLSENNSVSTADLNVSFIRPFTGDSFIFEVNVVHPGRKITRVRAIARDEATGKTLASAAANFVYASM